MNEHTERMRKLKQSESYWEMFQENEIHFQLKSVFQLDMLFWPASWQLASQDWFQTQLLTILLSRKVAIPSLETIKTLISDMFDTKSL